MLLGGLTPALFGFCLLPLEDLYEPASVSRLFSPYPSAWASPTLFVDPSPWELKHAFNSLVVLQGTAKGKLFNEAEKYLTLARSGGEDPGYIKLAESSLSVSRRQFKLAEKQAIQALSFDSHNSRFWLRWVACN
ncbi:MAG: hypothetical protein HC888_13580 [Candidatus Competibacteraceae bacterium]|nr:hypothetical protein [Candidatus Competibacteraceae bacterium]